MLFNALLSEKRDVKEEHYLRDYLSSTSSGVSENVDERQRHKHGRRLTCAAKQAPVAGRPEAIAVTLPLRLDLDRDRPFCLTSTLMSSFPETRPSFL